MKIYTKIVLDTDNNLIEEEYYYYIGLMILWVFITIINLLKATS